MNEYLNYKFGRLFEAEENHIIRGKRLNPRSKKLPEVKISELNSPKSIKLFGNLFGASYNTKDKKVVMCLIKSDTKELSISTRACELLMCKFKGDKHITIPGITIYKSFPCKDQDELVTGLLFLSSKVFSNIYDADINTNNCCANTFIIQGKDEFIFIVNQNEWDGDTEKPKPPASSDVSELVWVDVMRLMDDDDYFKNLSFGSRTFDILGMIADRVS